MADTTTFALLLRHYRMRQGLSMGALARRAGITKTTLSNWEADRARPSSLELENLLLALAIPRHEQLFLCHLVGRLRTLSLVPSVERPPLTGSLLRALRLRRRQTQSEVACALGIRQGTLAKWEASEDWPTPERLGALCTYLKAKPEETVAILSGVFLPLPFSLNAPIEWLCEEVTSLIEKASCHPDHPLLDLRFLELEALLYLRYDCPVVRELLWSVRVNHLIYLRLQERYNEAQIYADQLLAVSYDPQLLNSTPFQIAVIQKASILLGAAEMPRALRLRRAQAAISFLRAKEQYIEAPECQAWYWMYLGELLIIAGAPDEARHCIQHSNAIPYPGMTRLEAPEASLVTASHWIELGDVDAGLALLESPPLEQAISDRPVMTIRRTLTLAKALARGWDVSGANEQLRQAYQLMEETGIHFLRPRADALTFQLLHRP